MSFQNIEFLFGLGILVPLVVIFILVLKWKKNVRRQMGDEELINKLTNGYSARNYNWKFIFLAMNCSIF